MFCGSRIDPAFNALAGQHEAPVHCLLPGAHGYDGVHAVLYSMSRSWSLQQPMIHGEFLVMTFDMYKRIGLEERNTASTSDVSILSRDVIE